MGSTVRRALGAYCVAAAAAVAANFVATPLYDDGSTGFPVWSVLNWFMAAGVLVALWEGAGRKRRAGRDGGEDGLKPYLESNVAFYASALLALWYFMNWFGDLTGREDPQLWAVIDPLFVLAVGACGLRLWREAA